MTEAEVKKMFSERGHMVEDKVHGIPQRKFIWMQDAVEIAMEIVERLTPKEQNLFNNETRTETQADSGGES